MTQITHSHVLPKNVDYWDYYILCRCDDAASKVLQRMEFWDGTKASGNVHNERDNDEAKDAGKTPPQDMRVGRKCVYMTRDLINEGPLVLKKRFFYICDNNLIATLLLDQFENDDDTEHALTQLEKRDKTIWLYSNALLANSLYNLFSPEDIFNAVQFLAEKGFINAWWHDENDTQPLSKRQYYVQYNEPFTTRFSKPFVEEQIRIKHGCYEHAEDTPSANLTTEKPRKIKLEDTYKTEASRVKYQNSRAIKLGLPGTLPLEQWIVTLDHFGWACAFCQRKYTVLEHFMPLTHGKGTSKDNCVPSCHKCNGQKGTLHPSQVTSMEKAIQTIQQYLKTHESEDM